MLHYAANLKDLDVEIKKKVSVEGVTVLLVRFEDKIYAIKDKCPHLGASLSNGSIEEENVRCKAHGALFHLENGEVVEKAHLGKLKMPTKKAKTYPVEIKDNKIFIDI